MFGITGSFILFEILLKFLKMAPKNIINIIKFKTFLYFNRRLIFILLNRIR